MPADAKLKRCQQTAGKRDSHPSPRLASPYVMQRRALWITSPAKRTRAAFGPSPNLRRKLRAEAVLLLIRPYLFIPRHQKISHMYHGYKCVIVVIDWLERGPLAWIFMGWCIERIEARRSLVVCDPWTLQSRPGSLRLAATINNNARPIYNTKNHVSPQPQRAQVTF